jgi:hypothetical protein
VDDGSADDLAAGLAEIALTPNACVFLTGQVAIPQ